MPRYTPSTESQWVKLNQDSFTGDAKKALDAFNETKDEMNIQREILEDIMTKKLAGKTPKGMTPKFSYKWGQISYIMAEPKQAASKSSGESL